MRLRKTIRLLLAIFMYAAPASAQKQEVAFVDTTIFERPVQGIKRFADAIARVDEEFATRRSELIELHEKVQKQVGQVSYAVPLPADSEPMIPERRKAMEEKAEAMQHAFEQQQGEAERDYNRRMKEVTDQVHGDVRKSLEEFAKARGITLLLDRGRTSCCAGDRLERDKVDVTREFIEEYNHLHP